MTSPYRDQLEAEAEPCLAVSEADAWTNAAASVLAALIATGRLGGATIEACEIADQVIAQRRKRLTASKPRPAPQPLLPSLSFPLHPREF